MASVLLDWLDARLNPIMVKEVYQGFRSRAFVVSSQLLLLFCLFSFMLIALVPSSGGELGEMLFWVLAIGMWVLTLLGIPTGAGTQLRSEITDGTLDLIAITNLSPWAIISGRFQAAGLKVLLVFGFMGPFAIAAFLLGGIGVVQILVGLGLLLLGALGQCSLLLMISTLPALHPRLRTLARICQGILTLFLPVPILIWIGILANTGFTRWVSANGLVWLLLVLAYALALVFFGLRVAADTLSPPGIRNYARSRLALALLVCACLAPVIADAIVGLGMSRSEGEAFYIMALLHLYFWAVLWGGVSAKVSVMPQSWWERWLGDGYAKLFAYLSITTLLGASLGLSQRRPEEWLLMAIFSLVYYLFFTGLARAIRYLWKRDQGTLAQYFYILIALLMINSFASVLMAGLGIRYTSGAILVFLPFLFENGSAFEKAILWIGLPLLCGSLAAWLGRTRKHNLYG